MEPNTSPSGPAALYCYRNEEKPNKFLHHQYFWQRFWNKKKKENYHKTFGENWANTVHIGIIKIRNVQFILIYKWINMRANAELNINCMVIEIILLYSIISIIFSNFYLANILLSCLIIKIVILCSYFIQVLFKDI